MKQPSPSLPIKIRAKFHGPHTRDIFCYGPEDLPDLYDFIPVRAGLHWVKCYDIRHEMIEKVYEKIEGPYERVTYHRARNKNR